MTMRLVQPGQDRASAAIANQSAVDALTGSGYDPAGGDFAGFGKKDPTDQMRFANGPFYDATHPTYGAKNDDVTDDKAALVACANASFSTGVLQLPPGNGYRIKSSVTLNITTLRPLPGAKLRPEAGVTVTVNVDHIDAGASLVFDNSLGGKFVVNAKTWFHRPQWFGAMGLGSVTDDVSGWRNAFDSVPDSVLFRLSHGFNSFVRGTTVVSLRKNVSFIADQHLDADGTGGSAHITWDGPYLGRAFYFDRCQFLRFEGIYFHHITATDTSAGICGSMSLANPTHLVDTAGRSLLSFLPLNSLVAVTGAGGVAGSGDPLIARVLSRVSNDEVVLDTPCSTAVTFAEWFGGTAHGLPAKCMLDFDGEAGDGHQTGGNATIVAGNKRVVLAQGDMFPDLVGSGRTITFPTAGPGGTALVTTVSQVMSDTAFLITDTPSSSVAASSYTIAAPTVGASYGTKAIFTNCHYHSPFGPTHRGRQSVRVGMLSQTNHEFFEWWNCEFNGAGWKQLIQQNVTVSGTAVTTPGDYFNSSHLGMLFRGENCGAGGNTAHRAKVIAIIDTKHATLDVPAPTAQASTLMLLGEGIGVGVAIGQNSNSLMHLFVNCGGNGLQYIIDSGGSYNSIQLNSTLNERRARVRQSSRACMHVLDIGEADSGAVEMDGGGTAFTFLGGNYDINGIEPNGGVFDVTGCGNAALKLQGSVIEGTPLGAAVVFKGLGVTSVALDDVTFNGAGCSLKQLGLPSPVTASTSISFDNCVGLYIDDARTVAAPPHGRYGRQQKVEMHPSGGDVRVLTAALLLSSGYNGTPSAQRPSALRGDLDLTDNIGYTNGILAAVAAGVGQTGGHSLFGSGSILAAYLAQMPKPGPGGFGADNQKVCGLYVEPGDMTNGGTVGDEYGALIGDLRSGPNSGNLTRTHGYHQLGAKDDNLFSGPTAFGSKTTVKAVAAIVAGGGTDTFDASTLRVRRITANGNITVANPTNTPGDGDQLTIDILNNTAGPITVTLGTLFAFAFPAGAAGKRRTQRAVFDGTLGKYVPDGAQSGDF